MGEVLVGTLFTSHHLRTVTTYDIILFAKILRNEIYNIIKEKVIDMAFENLYQCNEQDITVLYKDLAAAFYDDDLYITVFPDEATRLECLQFFFRNYVEAIRSSCHFLADNDEMNSIMVVYDSRREQAFRYYLKLIRMNFRFLKFVNILGSFQKSVKVLKDWDMFTSRWTKEFVHGESFHLDMIITKEEARKGGRGSFLVKELLDEAQIMNMDVTVETHHEENASWYESLGFMLVNTFTHTGNDVKQFCLLIRNKEE